MHSLTHYIRQAKKIDKDYFGTADFRFPKLTVSKELDNPYPVSLGKRKLWGLMGTFTDYMIRKMFRDKLIAGNARVVREEMLVAETVSTHLPDLVLGVRNVNHETLLEIDWRGEKWVQTYLEEPWDHCISETFYMSQMDAVYRALVVGKFYHLDRDELSGLKQYFRRVLGWLRKEFAEAELVILNPVLGHPDVCKGDADLVIDNTLFDIKTVKRPVAEVDKSKNQLLGYLSLAHKHKMNPVKDSPLLPEVTAIGYIFPQSLILHSTEINRFGAKQREDFTDRILALRSNEASVSVRGEIDHRSNRAALRKILLHNRASRLEEMKRLAEAEAILRGIIEEDPGARVTWFALGRFLRRRGRYDEAEHAIMESIKISSGWPGQWHELAWVYLDQHQEEKALDALRSLVKHNPMDVQGWFSLGVMHHRLKNWKKAEEAYRVAIGLKNDYADALLNLGVLLYSLQRGEESRVVLMKGLEVSTDRPDLKKEFEDLLLKFDAS